jgi:phage-related protein
MAAQRKPVVWHDHHITSPPFTDAGKIEAGTLLRLLQEGEKLGPPQARPLPAIGANCGELRVRDAGHNWRINYFIDDVAIVILDLYPKNSPQAQNQSIKRSKNRLSQYLEVKATAKKNK